MKTIKNIIKEIVCDFSEWWNEPWFIQHIKQWVCDHDWRYDGQCGKDNYWYSCWKCGRFEQRMKCEHFEPIRGSFDIPHLKFVVCKDKDGDLINEQ